MKLRIIRCTERHFDEMVDFISALNPAGEHHIGYFGVTPEDVGQSIRMLNLRFDRGFRLALEGDRLVGVMGADIDKELGRAWLYGPVATAADWAGTADALYEAVQRAIPAGITEHQMFVDARNTNARAFAGRHGFTTHGEWAIYFITPERMMALPAETADAWDGRFTAEFADLHQRLFPHSNYTIAYIMDELEKGAVLLTLSDGDRLAGYFFGRAEPESGEGYVDLVGVGEAYRRSGLGRRLMLAGLAHLRRMPGLRQVNLTVAGDNEAAMRLYDTLGFIKERDMMAFQKRLHEA
jgi:ribosomal protein S18 acetylase RimI-like enzyme